MSLTNIPYGSLASSAVMNNNFEYLEDRIDELASTVSSNAASIASTISSLNSTFSEVTDGIISDAEDLADTVATLLPLLPLLQVDNAPDYDHPVSITLPYTVTQNGYVYAGVNGLDTTRYVNVNGHPVHGHCGYGGGKEVYSGSLFRVSAGDIVSSNKNFKVYYFYPMKGYFS